MNEGISKVTIKGNFSSCAPFIEKLIDALQSAGTKSSTDIRKEMVIAKRMLTNLKDEINEIEYDLER